MRVFQKTISLRTKKIYDFIKVTDELQEIMHESKIKDGVLFANATHNTAALILQEDDKTIFEDTINYLEKILPTNAKYAHNYEGNENATAHQKANLLGTTVNIPVKDNKLVLGAWQDVFLLELFEARTREIVVTIIGE